MTGQAKRLRDAIAAAIGRRVSVSTTRTRRTRAGRTLTEYGNAVASFGCSTAEADTLAGLGLRMVRMPGQDGGAYVVLVSCPGEVLDVPAGR